MYSDRAWPLKAPVRSQAPKQAAAEQTSILENAPKEEDDPGKQKWEQLRIRNALHSFDSLRAMQGNSKQTEASELRDLKVEGYKGSLLSESSARIFWGENAQNPAPQNPAPGLSM